MALTFVAAPDERRIQTDIDSRRRRHARPGGRVTKLIGNFHCVTPQCFRACASLHGQKVRQHPGGDSVGQKGGQMSRITKMDGVAVTLFDGFPLPLPDVP